MDVNPSEKTMSIVNLSQPTHMQAQAATPATSVILKKRHLAADIIS